MPFVKTKDLQTISSLISSCIDTEENTWINKLEESDWVKTFTQLLNKKSTDFISDHLSKIKKHLPALPCKGKSQTINEAMTLFIDSLLEEALEHEKMANNLKSYFKCVKDYCEDNSDVTEITFNHSFKKLTFSDIKIFLLYYSGYLLASLKESFTSENDRQAAMYNVLFYPNDISYQRKQIDDDDQTHKKTIRLMIERKESKNLLELLDKKLMDMKSILDKDIKEGKITAEEEDINNDYSILELGIRLLIKELLVDKLAMNRKIAQAKEKLIRNSIKCLKAVTSHEAISFAASIMDDISINFIEKLNVNTEAKCNNLDKILAKPELIQEKSCPEYDPDFNNFNHVLQLPFQSAPKVKSSLSLKKGVNPKKWMPGTSLWTHLKYTMEYAYEWGICEYLEKLKLIYFIFPTEHDRREYKADNLT